MISGSSCLPPPHRKWLPALPTSLQMLFLLGIKCQRLDFLPFCLGKGGALERRRGFWARKKGFLGERNLAAGARGAGVTQVL